MASHDVRVVFFLSLKLLFIHRTTSKHRTMAPLSKLSLVLVVVCIFIPIMILSITRGFQYFSINKLSAFYSPYFVNLDSPVDKSQVLPPEESTHIQAYYQDYLFLKRGVKESPSLVRVMPMDEVQNLTEQKNILFLRGDTVRNGEILLSESLSIELGADIGSMLEIFLFLPQNSFPVRETKVRVSGVISFQNALLDRSISIITPQTLENNFFIGRDKVNTFQGSYKKELRRYFSSSEIFSLEQMPSIKQMRNQHTLLLFLALASSCLCFFALFMNLKSNIKNQLYSMHIFRILGAPESIFIRAFFLQNILLIMLGITLGIFLSLLIIPHISSIVQGTQDLLNLVISFLKANISTFKTLSYVEFFPADVFYIRQVPVKMAFQDFFYLSIFLLGGMALIQKWYAKILEKQPILEILKKEQGI